MEFTFLHVHPHRAAGQRVVFAIVKDHRQRVDGQSDASP